MHSRASIGSDSFAFLTISSSGGGLSPDDRCECSTWNIFLHGTG
ncbi:hypothetical protein HMPREF7215_1881 [Pyramidobacter piscolens W5455]|uniref:Uncharacterized protein n=1 Tax=Pyramidobacter piscolens W5455 TaxID=352165 RepID=A0ABM9ZUK1_9BACT|nr:hypothetical protein HMPREF7215_1881 [Pyramidobacter piscolens W5455]